MSGKKLFPKPTPGAIGALSLGAVMPLLLAAGGGDALPAEVTQSLPMWAVMLISAASPACAWGFSVVGAAALEAVAAYLNAKGRAMVTDKDPHNDARGEAFLAAGATLRRRAARLNGSEVDDARPNR